GFGRPVPAPAQSSLSSLHLSPSPSTVPPGRGFAFRIPGTATRNRLQFLPPKNPRAPPETNTFDRDTAAPAPAPHDCDSSLRGDMRPQIHIASGPTAPGRTGTYLPPVRRSL